MADLGLQLMLAIANGAYILQPSFVTASREAGRWLSENDFLSTAEFVAKDGRTVSAIVRGSDLLPKADPVD